ncbi:hypothetical protein McaMca56_003720, partial [Microsporum canis]
EYFNKDLEKKIYTLLYLENLVSKSREWDDNIRDYVREYLAVSSVLVQEGDIAVRDQTAKFLRGLPESLRIKVMKRIKLDQMDRSTYDMDRAY